MAGKLTRANF